MTGTNTNVVEQTIRISASPETVWKYWTDSQRICDWWGAAAELDPRPGGLCRVEMEEGPVMLGEYLEVVPYERLVFSFGWVPTEGAPDDRARAESCRDHTRRRRRRHPHDLATQWHTRPLRRDPHLGLVALLAAPCCRGTVEIVMFNSQAVVRSCTTRARAAARSGSSCGLRGTARWLAARAASQPS